MWKRSDFARFHSFWILKANARRKNCFSLFVFPLVKNHLNVKSCLITPNAPSTWIERFILRIIPSSVVIRCAALFPTNLKVNVKTTQSYIKSNRKGSDYHRSVYRYKGWQTAIYEITWYSEDSSRKQTDLQYRWAR